MESPVVVDKPPEYHGNDRGFPFDEEEGAGAWSELAARHPDIAARLRQRPATWTRKRRPSSQDATDDFGESFGGFDRFPFDDIPPEFREHFPSHWNRRFGSREEHPQQTQAAPPPPPSPQPAQQQTAATQTEQDPEPVEHDQHTHLPQYGLRNTVDLGQKSPADPSLVDADERNQRSMSAPPDSCAQNQSFKMSGQNHHEQHPPQHGEQQSNVRHIPIFVEGRDEPVINRSVDHGTHFGDTKQTYAPPPPQPHIDREQYFADDGPVGFHHPPNFSRAFGTPFNKGYRQGPQPFVQQKAYPQAAFTRGASPQRSQSPKPQPHPDEHFVKVPVHHDQGAPKTETPSRAQRQAPQQQTPPQQKQQPPPQQKQPAPQQQAPPREQTPPPKPQQIPANDPITQILSIQTDVLNLMTEVENFAGTKKDKRYLYLDEMLTRNLIKLDTIETDGKENIRQARKEAIKCIQKCIAVLEAKADSNSASGVQPQTQDVEMNENQEAAEPEAESVTENGEVDMKGDTKEEEKEKVEPETQAEPAPAPTPAPEAQPELANAAEAKPQEEKTETQPQEEKPEVAPAENKEATQTQAADTRPEDKSPEQHTEKTDEQKEAIVDTPSPKKGGKVVKKRNKSKDNKKDEPNDSDKKESATDSNKDENPAEESEKAEVMQVDDKGDKPEPQVMEVDGAASQ